jgi:hypothetical protein
MWLEWGDIVEIPERDHKLNEQWQGMSQQVLDSLQRCVKRTVDIIVKGSKHESDSRSIRGQRSGYGGVPSGRVFGWALAIFPDQASSNR